MAMRKLPLNPMSKKGSSVLFRCLAAWSVFHSHQFAIFNLPEQGINLFGMTLGGMGIYTFFALSGYYVAGSFINRSFWSYGLSRFLRVWPAMAVSTLLTVLALGWVSSWGLTGYWHQPQTLVYLLHNCFLGLFPLEEKLPGLFNSNPLSVVNASLWTLPYIWVFYALLPLLGFKKLWLFWTITSLLAGLAAMAFIAPGQWFAPYGYRFDGFYGLVFNMVFFAGVGTRFLPIRWHLILALYVAVAFAFGWMVDYLPVMQWSGLLFWTIAVLWVCTRFHLDRFFARLGDPSYGMYLWAFPVQQVCYQYLAHKGFGVSYGVALAVTIILGYASWHWLEKPLLRLKLSLPQVKQTNNLVPAL